MTALDDIICEAKGCVIALAVKYANEIKYGEVSDISKWHFRQTVSYIRTLERNHTIVKHRKEISPVTSVDFNSLHKQNSFLSLRHAEVVTCIKTEISPCLSDSEINHIVEQIKILCSTYNCKCN